MRWPWISRDQHEAALVDQRTAHATQLARMYVDHLAELVENTVATRVGVTQQLVARLESRADAFRADAEHPTSGNAHTAPSQRGLTPEQRLVIEHELLDAARDLEHLTRLPERTPA